MAINTLQSLPTRQTFGGHLMNVSEIFHSVQGEGPNVGLPTVFLRLSGCNLKEKCSVPCDTKYAWEEKEEKSLNDVLCVIKSFQSNISYSAGRRLIVTGGEPLLQQTELSSLLSILKSNSIINFVEIETNGTIIPLKEMITNVNSWIVSPKTFPLSIETWQFLHKPLVNRVHLKFVINNSGTIHNLLETYQQIGHLIPPERIVLMPCATTTEEQTTILPSLIETAKIYGFRVSPRLQILAYGQKRGV